MLNPDVLMLVNELDDSLLGRTQDFDRESLIEL
jgi:hypothetical protein